MLIGLESYKASVGQVFSFQQELSNWLLAAFQKLSAFLGGEAGGGEHRVLQLKGRLPVEVASFFQRL